MSPALLKKAILHLRKDVRLKGIEAHRPEFTRSRDPFEALCRAIVGQQLSVKAAATIYARFGTIYGTAPTPRAVSKTPIAKLRAAGLSGQKASYVQDLARKFLDCTIEPSKFGKMTDEEIRAHLVAVKGIGRWTADMFLMFTLHRPDVLPTGDLGIQKGMQKVFKLKKLPSPDQMQKLAAPWAPHRSVACYYLWHLLDKQA